MDDRETLLKQALMNDTRLNLIQELGEAKHISELASKLEMDRSTIAYHLSLLKKVGIVDNEYRSITNPMPGWVGNYFFVNDEILDEAIALVEKEMELAKNRSIEED